MAERNRPGLAKDPRTRQFRDTKTGEIMSRRQAENVRIAKDAGWESWSQWQRTTSPTARETKESRRWANFADSAVHDNKYDTRAEARKPNSKLNQAWNAWRETGYARGKRGDSSDPRNAPGSPYAKALEASGKRTANAQYAVGDSPKRRKRR